MENLGANLTPSLCIFLEIFLVFQGHSSKLISVLSYVNIIFILANKGLTKVSKSMDLCAIQTHVPPESDTRQTILKVVD